MIGPRPALRNANSRSSADPPVREDVSTTTGPEYEGKSSRTGTVSGGTTTHALDESRIVSLRDAGWY